MNDVPTQKTFDIKKNDMRIAKWDNLRFILICAVVLGHFLDILVPEQKLAVYKGLDFFLYSFHIPTLIFLSGLFYRREKAVDNIVTFIVTGYMLKMALYATVALKSRTFNHGFSLLSENGVPWYIFALAAFTAIAYLLENKNRYFVLGFSILFAMVAGYDQSIGDFLVLSRIIVYFPLFWMGRLADREKLEEFCKKNWLKVLCLVLLIVWCLFCLKYGKKVYRVRKVFTGRHPFVRFSEEWGPLYRLAFYMISSVVGLTVIVLAPAKRLPLITLGGSRTMQIYFWHYSFLYYLLPYRHMFFANTRGQILWLLLSLPVTVILVWKPFRYPAVLASTIKKRSKE